ncbi:mpv17-like protein isoform X3 [Leopardus geoffroyi]|uniref:mpv17-like protein isoform X3 n=1 Tax=Leopardus geoffroyi TaxID=46844 RepID=UPI001E25EFB5|nr:mpv17-like protein isoform X3 [Leopardus geoffroyi]
MVFRTTITPNRERFRRPPRNRTPSRFAFSPSPSFWQPLVYFPSLRISPFWTFHGHGPRVLWTGHVSKAQPRNGMSILQEKDDIFLDLKQKFWNTYKSGLLYWPFVQLTNFSLVPTHWRTAYTGLCGFLWATFLCFSQQSGDGTFKSAFTFLHVKEAGAIERPPEK